MNFSLVKSPVVVLGEIPAGERAAVRSVLLKLQLPIYAEAHSGLREDKDLSALVLRSGDRFFTLARVRESFDSVIRIGGVPTVRLWRDLEEKCRHWPVISIHNLKWSGLSRVREPATSYSAGLAALLAASEFPSVKNGTVKNILELDSERAEKLQQLFAKYPLAEPTMFATISAALPHDARVFVGNSLPIREWDLAASYRQPLEVASNRGLNGIDGLVSTFLGWSLPQVENVLVLGDLSALYDLSGLWPLTRGLVKNSCKIVVINNGGGRIFKRMFRDDKFENSHEIKFSAWAEMFGLPYAEYRGGQWPSLTGSAVIEAVPDNQQTEQFNNEYESLFFN